MVPAIGVLTNDTSSNASPLTAVLNTTVSHGTLTLNPNGSFTYTPTSGYQGSDSFSYHANDGNTDSSVATVTLTITAYGSQMLVNGSFESGYTGWAHTGTQQIEGNGYYVRPTPSMWWCSISAKRPPAAPSPKASRRFRVKPTSSCSTKESSVRPVPNKKCKSLLRALPPSSRQRPLLQPSHLANQGLGLAKLVLHCQQRLDYPELS